MAEIQIQKSELDVRIREARHRDLESLREMSTELRQSKEVDYFEQQMEYQHAGERLILIAEVEEGDVG